MILRVKALLYRKVIKRLEKETTTRCPYCGNRVLALYRSLDKKVCYDCISIKGSSTVIVWKLDKGQKKVL